MKPPKADASGLRDTPRPRARDLGVPFYGTTGPRNAVTDVPGVEVGVCTRTEGTPRDPDEGPVIRTGVTAIHPLGREAEDGVAAARFVLNGMGEMTGSVFLDEYGALYGPMALTNTLSVGTVRDALIAWSRDRGLPADVLRGRTKPVVSETWDGRLNDVYGQHVTAEDAFAALDAAHDGPVPEGSVGGGTGMISFEFKSGTGTASRVADVAGQRVTTGVLVQSNFGRREHLVIAGVPVGRAIEAPPLREPDPARAPGPHGDGSIVVVIATDAPLLPFQLHAVAKRASLGLGRVGSVAAPSSGDLFLAFSTTNRSRYGATARREHPSLPTETLEPLYEAVVEATEEAIVNALIAAEPMTGIGGAYAPALPHDALVQTLERYGRTVGGS